MTCFEEWSLFEGDLNHRFDCISNTIQNCLRIKWCSHFCRAMSDRLKFINNNNNRYVYIILIVVCIVSFTIGILIGRFATCPDDEPEVKDGLYLHGVSEFLVKDGDPEIAAELMNNINNDNIRENLRYGDLIYCYSFYVCNFLFGFYFAPTLQRLYGDFPASLDLRCHSVHYFRHGRAHE